MRPGVSGRRHSAQGFLGALIVVFPLSNLDDDLGMLQTGDPVFAQILIQEVVIELLEVGALVRFSYFDQEWFHAQRVGQCQHRFTADQMVRF